MQGDEVHCPNAGHELAAAAALATQLLAAADGAEADSGRGNAGAGASVSAVATHGVDARGTSSATLPTLLTFPVGDLAKMVQLELNEEENGRMPVWDRLPKV
jgi:hypothetical protein